MGTVFHHAPVGELSQTWHGPAPSGGIESAVRVAGGLPTLGGGAVVGSFSTRRAHRAGGRR
jgi:hypothetical protein